MAWVGAATRNHLPEEPATGGLAEASSRAISYRAMSVLPKPIVRATPARRGCWMAASTYSCRTCLRAAALLGEILIQH